MLQSKSNPISQPSQAERPGRPEEPGRPGWQRPRAARTMPGGPDRQDAQLRPKEQDAGEQQNRGLPPCLIPPLSALSGTWHLRRRG